MHPSGVTRYPESARIPFRVFLGSQSKVKYLDLVCLYEQREPLYSTVLQNCHRNTHKLPL